MTIHQSTYPPVALTDLTITERLFEGLAHRRDEVVLVDGPTGRGLTAGAVMDGIRRLAGGLAARGYGPGQVVAILMPNLPEYVIAFHGPLWAGGTVTTLNPSYTAPEARHQLRDSGATLLITIPAFLATAREAVEGTGVTEIAVVGEADDATPLSAWMGEPLEAQVPVDVAETVAALPYSSGTTGLPKGVMLTHRSLVVNIDQCAVVLDAKPGEWTIAFLPFFHIYGLQVLMNLYLVAGARLLTMPRFDLEMTLRLIQEYRTPTLYCAPPVALALVKHPIVEKFDLSSLERVFSAAAPLSGDVGDALARRLGVAAVQGYGMTELSPVCHAIPVGATRSGSVGVALPSTECRIVDPVSGEDAVEGEVWVRGPQVMMGYHNNPAATAATIAPGGWLRTGDLGGIDADGYLFIRDRVKELIKVSGFQVAPAEVEAELLSHPAVADAAVVGRPDEAAGEVPVAFVVRQAGMDLDEAGVLAHLAGRLANFKQPRTVHFVDAVPKSPSGKILRRLLRDRV
jgi:acyl-CoA synthetase (AMP-forming)/AMP-acid ligase II